MQRGQILGIPSGATPSRAVAPAADPQRRRDKPRPALPVVIGAQVIDRDPGGLLSVRLEAHGWLSLLTIEPVLRSRLDEHVGTASPDEAGSGVKWNEIRLVDGVSPGPGVIVVCYSRWATRREIRTIEQGLPLTWIDHPTDQQETSLSPDLVPHHSSRTTTYLVITRFITRYREGVSGLTASVTDHDHDGSDAPRRVRCFGGRAG